MAEYVKESSMAHFGVPKEMLESARIVRKLISKARTEEHQSRSFATVDGGGALAQCAGTARDWCGNQYVACTCFHSDTGAAPLRHRSGVCLAPFWRRLGARTALGRHQNCPLF